jgi:signal transduction histidine kinase/ActR/RegA family two-component response regulator
VYLFEIAKDGKTFSCTHDACAPGVPSSKGAFTDIPIDSLPWGFGRLMRGEISLAENVAALPPEAARERALMEETGIRSFLTVPLSARGRVLGGIGFDWLRTEAHWREPTVGLLRLSGELIATTLLRVEAERERQRLESRLRQTERLEALGLLAAGVAHDFNNLLVAIVNYVDLARESLSGPPQVLDDLRQARTAADRATALTHQLLAFGRRAPGPRSTVDLNEVARGVVEMLRRVCPASVQLDFIPGHDLGLVLADVGHIEQVLMNLALNSIDAIVGQGRVTIETENVLLNGNYVRANPWARPGRYVLLSVSDDGRGMSSDVQQRIFEPFFTTKEELEGTGLGLSVVYGIVRQHDGMIHVYSELGQGTTFKVYLPVAERLAASVGPKLTNRVVGGKETILLAEDNEMVARVARRILEGAGYRVVLASNGLEAIRLFDEAQSSVDLALLDAVMPGASGQDVYLHLTARRPDLPIVFASGYAADTLKHELFRRPGTVLVDKPYDADTLLGKVREALDRRSRGAR